jgi:hypothetical protein
VLILREIIIVFGEDLKLDINLRRTIVIDFYNSGFIQSLSRSFSLQVERVFPHKSLCLVLVIYFRIPQVLGIRFYSQQVVSKSGLSGSDDRRRRKDVRN